MSDSTNAILQHAYELIENDDLEQAQTILTPLLETDDDNPALWWVYSHALRDRAIGQLALDRVLELDPSFPGAGELKADVLEVESRDPDLVELELHTSGGAQTASGIDIDDWEDLQPVLETESDSTGGRRGFVILAVILLIVVSSAALVISGTVDISELLSGILPSPEPAIIVVSAPTEAVAATEVNAVAIATQAEPDATQEPTSIPTAEDEVEATAQATEVETKEAIAQPSPEATPTTEATPSLDEPTNPLSAFVRDVADNISEFEISRASAVHNTLLGNTLVIQFCAVPGREFNARLNHVMNAMVGLVDGIPEDIEAVAAGLLNCDDEEASLRIIGVPVNVMQEYADEEIDAKDFQRAWQPLS